MFGSLQRVKLVLVRPKIVSSCSDTTPPKVGILIIISKFSKIKKLTQKGLLKFQKVKNRYKKHSNKKVLENRPLLTIIGRRENLLVTI